MPAFLRHKDPKTTGAIPLMKQETILSNLSEILSMLPVIVVGKLSPENLGKYCSEMERATCGASP